MSANDLYGTRIPNEREQRVIHLVAQGLKNHEVAKAIGTTKQVVKNYLRVIYDKLGFYNRVELALWHESRQAGPANPESDSAAPAGTQTGPPISTELEHLLEQRSVTLSDLTDVAAPLNPQPPLQK